MADFAIRVGLDPTILQFVEEDLEIYTSDSYPFQKTLKQARAEVILARAMKKFGLLDLKVKTRAKSRPRKPSKWDYLENLDLGGNSYLTDKSSSYDINRYKGGKEDSYGIPESYYLNQNSKNTYNKLKSNLNQYETKNHYRSKGSKNKNKNAGQSSDYYKASNDSPYSNVLPESDEATLEKLTQIKNKLNHKIQYKFNLDKDRDYYQESKNEQEELNNNLPKYITYAWQNQPSHGTNWPSQGATWQNRQRQVTDWMNRPIQEKTSYQHKPRQQQKPENIYEWKPTQIDLEDKFKYNPNPKGGHTIYYG